jgi:hypothetical protein
VDETPLDRALLKKQQVEAAVEQTSRLSYAKLRSIANAASGIVNMVENVLKTAGISISRTSAAVVQGIINIAGAYASIAAAEAVTPYQQIAAGITIAQSIVLMGVSQQMETQTSQMIGSLGASLSGIQQVAGLWRWDW